MQILTSSLDIFNKQFNQIVNNILTICFKQNEKQFELLWWKNECGWEEGTVVEHMWRRDVMTNQGCCCLKCLDPSRGLTYQSDKDKIKWNWGRLEEKKRKTLDLEKAGERERETNRHDGDGWRRRSSLLFSSLGLHDASFVCWKRKGVEVVERESSKIVWIWKWWSGEADRSSLRSLSSGAGV